MNLTDELKKLEDLHWRGALSDAEYAKAKDALVTKTAPPALPRVEGIDRRLAQHFMPTPMMALIPGIGIGMFGIVWTILAISITSGAPAEGPFIVAKFAFPLFGLIFTGVAVFMAMAGYRKAKQYEADRQRRDPAAK